jgi:hypothetical protein
MPVYAAGQIRVGRQPKDRKGARAFLLRADEVIE